MAVKILLLSRYDKLGASSRYRCFQYIPFLKNHGLDITIKPLLGDIYIKRRYSKKPLPFFHILNNYLNRIILLINSNKYDIIWLQAEAFPWIPYWLEALLYKSNIPIVTDYDDAVFHRYDMHNYKLVRVLLKRKIDNIMKRSTIVIAGNEYIAERALKSGAKNIVILPTVVDLNLYPIIPKPNDDVFTIGWIGSPSTTQYLGNIMLALEKVNNDYRAKLKLIGAEKLNNVSIPTEYITWSMETEIQEIQNFDVGIMPLSDSPWEKGKCGFKLIQYMACSRPVIGSPIGVNQNIIEHGVNGFFAQTNEDWINALQTLKSNPELRRVMGKNGRKKIEQQFSLEKTAPRLTKIFENLKKN